MGNISKEWLLGLPVVKGDAPPAGAYRGEAGYCTYDVFGETAAEDVVCDYAVTVPGGRTESPAPACPRHGSAHMSWLKLYQFNQGFLRSKR